MEKITETLICDICNMEIGCPDCVSAEELKSKHRFKVLVRRYFDDTDGRTFYESPRYDYVTIDICDECLEKAVVLKDVGVQCLDVQFDEAKATTEVRKKRQDAIDAVYERIKQIGYENSLSILSIGQAIRDLPSAQPEPNSPVYYVDGYADGQMVYDSAECPTCGYIYEQSDSIWGEPFCPHCGQVLDWGVKGADDENA